MFQSTPDLINRENTAPTGAGRFQFQFQSTPDLINRENAHPRREAGQLKEFQSTPDLINRENGVIVDMVGTLINVSIHSRFN